jgi:hypothetical protein
MGVRWAPQRRANRASEELNTRLKLRIQPFKLTRRQVLIDRPVFDPEVLRAAEEYSRRLSNLIRSMQYCECDCAPAVIARLDRATQYPEAAVTEPNGRGVLDPRMRGDDIRGCGGLPRYIQPLTSLQKLEV